MRAGRGVGQPRTLPAGGEAAGGTGSGAGRRTAAFGNGSGGVARTGGLEELKGVLADHDLYVFTINGFPYGPFHGRPVKEQVYQPDWRQEVRVTYSDRLADLLAELLPEDPALHGSISTVPGTFKPLAQAPGRSSTWRAT